MARAVDADVARARFHPERVELTMIVVRVAVAFVHRDVEFVGAFDEVEALDRERRLRFARQPFGIHLL